MRKIIALFMLACAFGAAASTVATNAESQIVYTVGADETLTVSTAWPTDVAGVVKEGTGTLVLGAANASFAHPLFVNAGRVETAVDNAFGADVVTVADGAAITPKLAGTVQGGTYFRKCKNVKIAGSGPDGLGAITFSVDKAAGDHLFPCVTLTADAMFGGTKRWGVDKIDLAGHTLTVNAPGTYHMFNGNKVLNPGHIRVRKLTFLGAVTMNGGSANTMTLYPDGGVLNFWGSSTACPWTLVVQSNATLSAGGDQKRSRNYNKWTGPVQIAEGQTMTVSSYDSTENVMQFTGVVSGAGAFRKITGNDCYLDAGESAPNTYSGGTTISGGRVFYNRPGALPFYDIVGKFGVAGGATAAFYCLEGRWTPAQIKTAVDTSTSFAATGRVQYELAQNQGLEVTTPFNKSAVVTTGGSGTLTWKAAPVDGTKVGFHNASASAPIVIATGAHTPCQYLGNVGGTLRLEGGTDLDLGSDITPTLGGTRTVISNATLRTVLTAEKDTKALYVQASSGAGSVLEILDGAVISNRIDVGRGNGTRGAVYQRGGYVRQYARGSNDAYCGDGNAQSYGYYELNGGEIEIGGWFGFGHGTGSGVLAINAGEYRSGFTPISRGGWGRVQLLGGTLKSSNTLYVGEQQWGAGQMVGDCWVTVAGTGAVLQAAQIALCQRTNTYTAVLNLNAGVVAASAIYEEQYAAAQRSASAKSFLTANGGTFRATADHSDFLGSQAAAIDRATLYAGGLTVDTAGKDLSLSSVPLRKPEGCGVASITYPSSVTKTGYIGSPEVHVEGGGGEGATAYLAFDSQTGTIGDVEVTSAGWNYTTPPTVWFYTPGRTTAVTCTVTLTEGEPASGGLTKIGSGQLRLASACTYTGDTVISNGYLHIMNDKVLPVGNTVRLAGEGARLAVWTNQVTLAGFGGWGRFVTTISSREQEGALTVTDRLVFDAADLVAGRAVTVSGVQLKMGADVAVEIAHTNLLPQVGHVYPLVKTDRDGTFASDPALRDLPPPWMLQRSADGRTLNLVYQAGTVIILR